MCTRQDSIQQYKNSKDTSTLTIYDASQFKILFHLIKLIQLILKTIPE